MYTWFCIHASELLRTSRDGQRKASALFSQLASPVDRCRVEWKSRLKGSTLSIKKLTGTFKGQFPFTQVARRKQRKGSILCAKKKKKSKIVCEFYFATAITFYLPRTPNLLAFFILSARQAYPTSSFVCL